ncbi:hypothetical protein BDQ17DRAFT_1369616 [Cyathus striatus]|nr:hypothetical protein BDQ17DRAFT_1369616 [Cyathus striatus]
MATGIIQDTMQNSSSNTANTPRFRPYASAKHHVTKGRYITSNDPRGYIPVYEYPLNGQWIMMDIDDGYILWTGIWKALGNSKADIVKMIDSQPDLAPLIRRVRGGYLKIQGTWMPYEVALRLSRRVAWTIRDDLIPLFGPTFPSTCLSPDQPGYGQVVASGNGRRRARRTTQSALMKGAPATDAQSWTVVTPGSHTRTSHPHPLPHQHQHQHSPPHYSQFPPPSAYNPPHPHAHQSNGSVPPDSPSLHGSHSHEHMQSHRYSPYMGHTKSPKGSLSLDIPPRSSHGLGHSSRPGGESITLPPLRTAGDKSASDSPYALPPISALEDLRGVNTSDSAAVLRRLKLDDNDFAMESERQPSSSSSAQYPSHDSSSSSRRHSLNAHPYASRTERSPHLHALSRSYQERRSSSVVGAYGLRRSQSSYLAPSDASHEGDSTGGTSPITPTTPQSSYSGRESSVGIPSYAPPRDQRLTGMFGTDKVPLTSSILINDGRGVERVYSTSSVTRRSPYDADSDSDSNSVHPHRPW